MTELVTPALTEERIGQIADKIEDLIEQQAGWASLLAQREPAWKRVHARALLDAYEANPKAKVSIIEATATLASAAEYEAYVEAREKVSSVRAELRSLERILSSWQSLNANVRNATGLGR